MRVGALVCVLAAFLAIGDGASADMYPRQPRISVQKYSFDVTLSDTPGQRSLLNWKQRDLPDFCPRGLLALRPVSVEWRHKHY